MKSGPRTLGLVNVVSSAAVIAVVVVLASVPTWRTAWGAESPNGRRPVEGRIERVAPSGDRLDGGRTGASLSGKGNHQRTPGPTARSYVNTTDFRPSGHSTTKWVNKPRGVGPAYIVIFAVIVVAVIVIASCAASRKSKADGGSGGFFWGGCGGGCGGGGCGGGCGGGGCGGCGG
jgi:hypothetical protein